jgi:hypothetical protein
MLAPSGNTCPLPYEQLYKFDVTLPDSQVQGRFSLAIRRVKLSALFYEQRHKSDIPSRDRLE